MDLERIVDSPHYDAFQGYSNKTVVDMVTPDMQHLIHPYWHQFAPMNPLWHGILGFFMVCIGIVSISGNFCVIYIFTCTRSLRTPSNLFVVNLAISDFLMMCTMSPPMVLNCYYETWVLGPLMCQVYAGFGSLFGCVSIWTMTMIALDRYNVIVKGIAGTPLTIGAALGKIGAIWIFAMLWTIAPCFGWNRYVPEGNMTACGTDYLNTDWSSRSYILTYAIFAYYTPLFTIMYSYYFILKAVSEHERAMREQAKKMNVASLRSGEDANKSAEAKLAKVALVTISLFYMAWTPYLIINYMGVFRSLTLSPLGTIWGSVFAKTNACYNPIVYGISHPKYQAALFEKFPCLECGKVEPAGGDTQSQATQEKAPA